MKKSIITTLFFLSVFLSFSQNLSYFKFKGFETVYVCDEAYNLRYKEAKNFLEKVVFVSYDSLYVNRVYECNYYKIQDTKKDISLALLDESSPSLLLAIEYSDLVYSENLKYKSKDAKKINSRINFYKSRLISLKDEYNKIRELQISNIKKKQDSISLENQNRELEKIKFQAELDSIEQYKTTFFDPKLIVKVVGMPNATKQNLESEYQVELLMHRGGWDYYDFNLTNVGFKFGGNTNVCYKISFRLFGEDATDYENQIKSAGFKCISRKESSNLELEGDLSSQLMNGEIRIYRKGNVVCEVFDGSYLGFTYYRVK